MQHSKNKTISYCQHNNYSTYGTNTEKTKEVWIVFHGYGQLASYFIKHFHFLDPETSYVIAPEAPSKFYLDSTYGRVGASWLSKHERENGIINNLAYLDKLFQNENLEGKRINLLGFSQGVSMALRYMVHTKLICSKVVLWAGNIPPELSIKDTKPHYDTTPFYFVVGDEDPYVSAKIVREEADLAATLFANRTRISFKGKHHLDKKILSELLA